MTLKAFQIGLAHFVVPPPHLHQHNQMQQIRLVMEALEILHSEDLKVPQSLAIARIEPLKPTVLICLSLCWPALGKIQPRLLDAWHTRPNTEK